MSHGGLGSVIRSVLNGMTSVPSHDISQLPAHFPHGGHSRLRLWNVDNGTRHAANQDHTTRGIAVHQVLRNAGGEQVCAVDIHIPELAHALNGVVDGLEVLGEPGAGNQVVDLPVLLDHAINAALHGFGVGDICIVCRHLRNPHGTGILPSEYINKLDGLLLSLFLCRKNMLLAQEFPTASEIASSSSFSGTGTREDELILVRGKVRQGVLECHIATPSVL